MKFKVGDAVTLTSKYRPDISGDYIVEGAYPPEPGDLLMRTGEESAENVYRLQGLIGVWVESSLSLAAK